MKHIKIFKEFFDKEKLDKIPNQYLNTINENVKNVLLPKSDDEIKKELSKLDVYDRIEVITKNNLSPEYLPSKEEIAKAHEEKYNSYSDKWSKGYFNTETLKVKTPYWNIYIPKCKSCDEVTELKNCFIDRQMIGNVYQTLCNCSKCNKYILLDEDKYDDLMRYIENNKEVKGNNDKL